MDAGVIEQLAREMWPLVASGAAGHIGARGSEEALESIQDLWERIRRSRRDRGLDEQPADENELRAELERFSATEPNGDQVLHVVHNHFAAPIVGEYFNFGIDNRSS